LCSTAKASVKGQRWVISIVVYKERRSKMEEWLRIGAYVGSMLTSMIAAGASAVYWVDRRSKRRRLEDYLKARKERSPHEAFSKTRLMADLGMTEAEIFAASFASRHIARGVRRDKATGFAAEVLFQYREDAKCANEATSDSPSLVVSQHRIDHDESTPFGRR
jgi:hypothetical protein